MMGRMGDCTQDAMQYSESLQEQTCRSELAGTRFVQQCIHWTEGRHPCMIDLALYHEDEIMKQNADDTRTSLRRNTSESSYSVT